MKSINVSGIEKQEDTLRMFNDTVESISKGNFRGVILISDYNSGKTGYVSSGTLKEITTAIIYIQDSIGKILSIIESDIKDSKL